MDQSDYLDGAEQDGGGGRFLALLPVILWQRKWWIVGTVMLGIIAASLTLALVPPVYRSQAVLLVESPQLPAEVIEFDANDMIERRMASIMQQITARPDLIELIERHGLYDAERQSGSVSEAVEKMRDAISVTPTEGSLGQSAPGQSSAIAFELAFEYAEPQLAQAVAQDLMDKVVQLDSRGNAEQAENTVQFLTDQATAMESQIAQLQGQIATINGSNGSVLAEGMSIIGSNAGSYDVQIAALQRDNQALLQQRELALSSDNRDPILLAAEQRLAAARAIYAETHPDVVYAKQALEEARRLAATNVARIPVDSIDRQIAFNNSQIAALRGAKSQEEARVSSQMQSQARAPLVRQQLEELQQRLAAVNTQYQRVQDQLMAANAGVRAEDQRMAERLSVVDPPVVPDEPSWPNRLMLALGGIGGGLGLGLLLALAAEMLLRPIRDPEVLKTLAGAAPLGVVPVITTQSVKKRWWHRGKRAGKRRDT